MSRHKLLILWLVCFLGSPVLLFAMLLQASFGSRERAKAMAVAYDECANSLTGGPAQQTISARTGDALLMGKQWAKDVAPLIDFFFGKGHCLSNVDLTEGQLTDDQKRAVNEACEQQGVPTKYTL